MGNTKGWHTDSPKGCHTDSHWKLVFWQPPKAGTFSAPKAGTLTGSESWYSDSLQKLAHSQPKSLAHWQPLKVGTWTTFSWVSWGQFWQKQWRYYPLDNVWKSHIWQYRQYISHLCDPVIKLVEQHENVQLSICAEHFSNLWIHDYNLWRFATIK